MKFAESYEGVRDPDGVVVLDLKGLDIEGVTKLALRWSDLEAVRSQAAAGHDAAQAVRDLFSNMEEEGQE